ncbi:MAG: MATE family efflux transporter [Rhodobacteraceae bacterium]|nr:MATE family efflux transporter [Paracoccaceae bacterium]
MSGPSHNEYLTGKLPVVFVKTALPIVFLMVVDGLLTVVDAMFLGQFVGPKALAAVTIMFPAFIVLIGLSTLVASGMSSLLSRALGAQKLDVARSIFAEAHLMAVVIAALLNILYIAFGSQFALMAAKGDASLAQMADSYIRIAVYGAPLFFILSVQADALRCEGKIALMAGVGGLITLANIGLNYILIVHLNMGVAGSALGSVLAQGTALVFVLVHRSLRGTRLPLSSLVLQGRPIHVLRILALGGPQSLSFMGLALSTTVIVAAVQFAAMPNYSETIAAYGILIRIIGFAFMPLLGLMQAMQAIVGNNFGAGQQDRVQRAFRFAVITSLVYCLGFEVFASTFASSIAAWFVPDPAVQDEVARILPIVLLLYVVVGPVLMLGAFYQVTGNALRAAILQLAKPYLLMGVLVFSLSVAFGEAGIWFASPVADAVLLVMAITLYRKPTKAALSAEGLRGEGGPVDV